MIFKENYIYAGKILKTHGFKGELLISTEIFTEDYLKKRGHVFIEINGIHVPFFIEDYFFSSANRLSIKFEDLNSDKEADEYTGCDIYVISKYVKDSNHTKKLNQFIGYKLSDIKSGRHGIIVDMIDVPGNPLIKVKMEDNEECLIPFNEKLVNNLDKKNRQINMNLPDGLLKCST